MEAWLEFKANANDGPFMDYDVDNIPDGGGERETFHPEFCFENDTVVLSTASAETASSIGTHVAVGGLTDHGSSEQLSISRLIVPFPQFLSSRWVPITTTPTQFSYTWLYPGLIGRSDLSGDNQIIDSELHGEHATRRHYYVYKTVYSFIHELSSSYTGDMKERKTRRPQECGNLVKGYKVFPRSCGNEECDWDMS
ncbi:hypothetical protein F5I97DRAFT_337314 [Phlebopus sp. FC_14]|nr:hypothetical protein F5I97DRAFT_337314 [Phlebopus sp. FC_14]